MCSSEPAPSITGGPPPSPSTSPDPCWLALPPFLACRPRICCVRRCWCRRPWTRGCRRRCWRSCCPSDSSSTRRVSDEIGPGWALLIVPPAQLAGLFRQGSGLAAPALRLSGAYAVAAQPLACDQKQCSIAGVCNEVSHLACLHLLLALHTLVPDLSAGISGRAYAA